MNKKFAKTLAMVLVIAMLLSLGSFAFADADTTAADDGNDYPIVLVHGLFGWGGTEIANLNYWGGFSSLQQMLTDADYEVYTPSIGPVASNWDRACELYAYLVGTRSITASTTRRRTDTAATAAPSRASCPSLTTPTAR